MAAGVPCQRRAKPYRCQHSLAPGQRATGSCSSAGAFSCHPTARSLPSHGLIPLSPAWWHRPWPAAAAPRRRRRPPAAAAEQRAAEGHPTPLVSTLALVAACTLHSGRGAQICLPTWPRRSSAPPSLLRCCMATSAGPINRLPELDAVQPRYANEGKSDAPGRRATLPLPSRKAPPFQTSSARSFAFSGALGGIAEPRALTLPSASGTHPS